MATLNHKVEILGITPKKKIGFSGEVELIKFKVVILVDEAVGKTSILKRFLHNEFDSAHQATIGIDFLSKSMYTDDLPPVRLQFWDTAGIERFRALMPSYIKDSGVAMIVYDISDERSFVNIQTWISAVHNENVDMPIVLVGNKNDLVDKRQVTFEEGEAKAKELGAKFVETSAESGFNIKCLFHKVASSFLEKHVTQKNFNIDMDLTIPEEVEPKQCSDPSTSPSVKAPTQPSMPPPQNEFTSNSNVPQCQHRAFEPMSPITSETQEKGIIHLSQQLNQLSTNLSSYYNDSQRAFQEIKQRVDRVEQRFHQVEAFNRQVKVNWFAQFGSWNAPTNNGEVNFEKGVHPTNGGTENEGGDVEMK